MPSLKETRDRISSIGSIMKITSAMKMVSASKLKKSQALNTHLRLYFDYLEGIYKKLATNNEKRNLDSYKNQKKPLKELFILIGSNKGLCGSFNHFILKEAEKIKKKNLTSKIEFLSIGKKISLALLKKYKVYKDKSEILDKLSFELCAELIKELEINHKKGFFQSIKLVYNYPKRTSVSEVKIEKLFSLEQQEMPTNDLDFILEPSKEMIFETLISERRKIQLYKALVESSTAEHAARMLAMHQASENATELKSSLSLIYNKSRQASITKEIIEISSQS